MSGELRVMSAQDVAVIFEHALEAMRSAEWGGWGHDVDDEGACSTWPCCPVCGAPSPIVSVTDVPEGLEAGKHVDDCALFAAIKEAEAARK